MPLSNTITSNLLNAMFGKVSSVSIASTCYIGLLTQEPYEEEYSTTQGNVTTTGTRWVYPEPTSDAGYERVFLGSPTASSANVMGTPDENRITNAIAIGFNAASESWGTITHFALFSTKTGGAPYMWGELSAPVEIPEDYDPIFRPGKFTLEIQ